MRVYVLKQDDYYGKTNIIGVYNNYEKVINIIDENKNKIEIEEKDIIKCMNCKYNKIPQRFYTEVNKPECFSFTKDAAIFKNNDYYCSCKGHRYYEIDSINENTITQPIYFEEFELQE